MTESTWEIDGYLLGDPSIDRQVFEQRMLDDPDFALEVANAAETLELVALAASHSCQPIAATVASRSDSHKHSLSSSSTISGKIALAVAATLMMGIASTLLLRSSQRGFDEVANNWVALEQDLLPNGSTVSETPNHDATLDPELEIVTVSNSEDEEWLIDSAIAFYSDNEL